MNWVGIDFSGNHLQWRQSAAADAIWIAQIAADGNRLVAHDLRRVQELPGAGPPFERLIAFLKDGRFDVAAIDAPFSPPAAYIPNASREALLAAVQTLPCGGRPFPSGAQLVSLLAPHLAPRGKHVFRASEQLWRRRGVNVRSMLWNGPRGGAPFGAACLRLLALTDRPAWPWHAIGAVPVLAEAFPTAQLRNWNLPYEGYNGRTSDTEAQRRRIIAGVVRRVPLDLPESIRSTMIASADALDSVLCALAARAVSADALAEPPETGSMEGWMAVHR